MSLFSWFSAAKKPPKSVPPESSGLSRMDATRPVGRNGTPLRSDPNEGNAQAANRKGERMARRELLYTVVRDAMVRSGVLSQSYKFKVLSLDARGRQFMVMVDLARESRAETSRLAEIEAMVAQGAKSRYDIVVTAVYWRMSEHVAVGKPVAPTAVAAPAARSMPQRGARLPDLHPVQLDSAPAPLEVAQPAHGRYEPIVAAEVDAFKKALAAGSAKPAPVVHPAPAKPAAPAAALTAAAATGASAKAFDGTGQHGPQSYTLLTGFEDTEMPDTDVRMPALSTTQYGELN